MLVRTHYSSRPDETGFYPTPDGVTVRFRENILEEEAEEGTQWSADEYSVHLKCRLDMARRRVERNREKFLAQAKELAKTPLEKLTVNDIAEALVELGELLAEQDDALVELAEMIEEG